MKNLIYLLPALAIGLLSHRAMAQGENDTIYNRNNSLFAQLDTGRIPTGYLMDRAMAAGGNFFLSDGENPEAPVLNPFRMLDNLWLLNQAAVKSTPLLKKPFGRQHRIPESCLFRKNPSFLGLFS